MRQLTENEVCVTDGNKVCVTGEDGEGDRHVSQPRFHWLHDCPNPYMECYFDGTLERGWEFDLQPFLFQGIVPGCYVCRKYSFSYAKIVEDTSKGPDIGFLIECFLAFSD